MRPESYAVYNNGDGTHHVLALVDSGGFIVDGGECLSLPDAVRLARDLGGGTWPLIADEHPEMFTGIFAFGLKV